MTKVIFERFSLRLIIILKSEFSLLEKLSWCALFGVPINLVIELFRIKFSCVQIADSQVISFILLCSLSLICLLSFSSGSLTCFIPVLLG